MTAFDPSRRRLLLEGITGAAGLFAGRSLAALTATRASSVPKRVFAHYMVCCPTAGGGATVADFKNEIRQAQARGLDGFALNCGGWDKGDGAYYKQRCVQIYESARQLGTGFHLFVSMDYCCGNGLEETRDALQTFRSHPNQFKVGGKPVLSTFAGESRDPKTGQDKITLVQSLGGFFVPYFYPKTYQEHPAPTDVDQVLHDYSNLDGYFYFGAVGDGASISRSNRRLARAWHAAGKVFMADVSPYYRSFGRLSETHGFTSMAQEWEGAIQDNADWIEITTWNDWSEKTYVAPFGPPSETKLWDGSSNSFGTINYSHVAYLDASRYYIDWFKTGKRPRITQDKLFYFYRTEPKAATGKQFAPNETERGLTAISGADTLEDHVYMTCFLTKPARLTIHSGSASRAFVVPAGIHHVEMPFSLGEQRFTLTRNDRMVKEKTGEHQIVDRQGETRYNYFAGEA